MPDSNNVAQKNYQAWLDDPAIDKQSKDDLFAIAGDSKEIEDRFYTELQFGTAGLRGILGVGSNRMNRYTVAKASQGYADTLLQQDAAKDKGVVIAYDSRLMSAEFALETALVLCGNGIKCYLSDAMRSVPQLSFAIGHYGCAGGVVITASHNPKEYNGYKVYGANGAQIGPELAFEVTQAIDKVVSFSDIKRVEKKAALEAGLLVMVGQEWDEAYFSYVQSLSIDPQVIQNARKMPIVYTPLYGTGASAVPRILRSLGFDRLHVVPEQARIDPAFPSVSAPNPEAPDAFALAIALADEIDADLALATDPDADRLGVAVRGKDGAFQVLSGNQIGCLLLHYLLSQKKRQNTLPTNAVVVRSIVSSSLADAITQDFNAKTEVVLTGFRYIGEIVDRCVREQKESFLFGFEESYGFLTGDKIRDKDAICAAMLLAESAAHFAGRGMTLLDGLGELYQRYGYYGESVQNYTLYGKSGVEQIRRAMEDLRQNPPQSFASCAVLALRDYQTQERTAYASGKTNTIALPQSDVLFFELADESWICIRPSGTEPKLKFYVSAKSETYDAVQEKLKAFTDALRERLDPMLAL